MVESRQPGQVEAAPAVQPEIEAIRKPKTPGEVIAYIVSQLGSPPMMGLLGLVVVARRQPDPRLWLWIVAYGVFALIMPFAFLIWQVRHGHITDIEIHLREQRSQSLLVSMAGFGVTGAVLFFVHAPFLFILLACIGFLLWFAIFLITLRWKISVHSASATSIMLLLIYLLGTAAAPLLLVVPVIAWSRVKLRRHTPAQTAAGAVLGGMTYLLAYGLSKLFAF